MKIFLSITLFFGIFILVVLFFTFDKNTNIQIKPIRLKNVNNDHVKACIFILCRDSDLNDISASIINFEKVFNSKYNYDYVIVNDVEFSVNFKNTIKNLTNSIVKFGVVPKEHWSYPPYIDQNKAKVERERMHKNGNIQYALSESYRFMCRYYSGYFFRHPLVQHYDYYLRIDSGKVKYTCDLKHFDFFKEMRDGKYEYGFTIAIYEQNSTIPTLWRETLNFLKANADIISNNSNSLNVIMDSSNNYNLCHFYNNFEIGSFKFLRDERYLKYFDYLDKTGGFFYERWGDAAVHSIAVALFLPKSKIKFFDQIGYAHNHHQYCPSAPVNANNCKCPQEKSYHLKQSTYQSLGNSCLKMWTNIYD